MQWVGGSVCGLTVGFTSYQELLFQEIFQFLSWYNIIFPLNFQEMDLFVHQNVPNSLTVNTTMIFIHS